MNYKNIGIILSFILSSQKVFSIPNTVDLNEEECLTEECYETSKKFLSAMDTSVNPCEDFYQFTCGNWGDEMHDNFSYVQKIIDERAEEERTELLSNDYKMNENLTKEEQEYEEKLFNKMKDIFNVCLNEGQNEEYGKEYITEFINKLNIYESMQDISDIDKLTRLIVKLENNGFEMFFRYKNKFYMYDNSAIFFHYKYWKMFEKTPEISLLLKNSIKNILRITHSDEKIIEEKAEEIFKFDQKLNNIKMNSGDMILANYELLSEKYPFINWKLYFEMKFEFYGIEKELDYINLYLTSPNILEEISNIVRETDIKTLTYYMEWYTTVYLTELSISEEFDKAYSELDTEYKKFELQYNPTAYIYNSMPTNYDYSNISEPTEYDYTNVSEPTDYYYTNVNEPTDYYYTNVNEPTDYEYEYDNFNEPFDYEYGFEATDYDYGYEPTDYSYETTDYPSYYNDFDDDYYNKYYEKRKYRKCSNIVNSIMPLATTKFFIDRDLSKETRNKTKIMLGYIRESMMTRISTMEWLDEETKEKAKEKVMKMKEIIGYPDDIMNAKYIYQQYKDIEVKDYLTLTLYNKVGNDREIFDPFGQIDMIMTVNAYYIDESNTININAAILNSPFINSDSPDYLNYGAIGVLLGHELTHAFDSGGRYFDSNGKKSNWWNDDDDENYNELAQCFIDEYNKFSLNGQYLDGNFTLRENIADNGGIARAYDAWQLSLKSNSEEASERNKKLPGFSDYTLDQLFYIAYGHYYCNSEDTIMEQNNHSPSRARVNVVLSNSEHFVKTFNCPKNSPMNHENKCEIW